MKRIAIDARYAVRERRGIGHYSYNLINELINIDKINLYYLYIDQKDVQSVLPIKSNVRIRVLPISFYPIWEQISLPLYLLIDKIDLLHCLGNTGPIFSIRKCKMVVTIHDVMFLKREFESKNYYQKLGTLYKSIVTPIIALKFDKILTVSKFSKYDIAKTLNINLDKVAFIYNSSHIEANINLPIMKIEDDKIRFLALGGHDKRKNNFRVLNVYKKLKKDYNCSLTIVGFTPKGREEFLALSERLNLTDISLLGYITDKQMIELFHESNILYYPSLYEGFGIPLLEAMKAGIAIIGSNTTSIPEVLGEAGILVNPCNDEEIYNASVELITNKKLYNDLIAKGFLQSAKFNWKYAAEKTLSIYNEVTIDGSK